MSQVIRIQAKLLNFNEFLEWLNSITLENVAVWFRKAVVYPFNQDAITCIEGQMMKDPQHEAIE